VREQLSAFVAEADRGCSCQILELKDSSHVSWTTFSRAEAVYRLADRSQRLELQSLDGEKLGSWPLHSVLGPHCAENSALVCRYRDEILNYLSQEELERAVLLEFGSGAMERRQPMLLIEATADRRKRFVNGMQILRLYQDVAQRMDSGRNWNAQEDGGDLGST
jgi:hypothetical protein